MVPDLRVFVLVVFEVVAVYEEVLVVFLRGLCWCFRFLKSNEKIRWRGCGGLFGMS